MNKLRIFLAEDHQVVREGIKRVVNAESDMEVVGEAGDGLKTLEAVLAMRPDIILMDISMPELDGVQTTRMILKEWPQAKVLALTAYEDRGFLRAVLEDGAVGYLLKVASPKEVIDAIRIVANGSNYLDANMASEMFREYMNKGGPERDGLRARLSERESEVVRQIAQGFSNKEIAAQLNISVKTVETYKARAMEKLQLQSRADIVQYAIQQGWLSIKPDAV